MSKLTLLSNLEIQKNALLHAVNQVNVAIDMVKLWPEDGSKLERYESDVPKVYSSIGNMIGDVLDVVSRVNGFDKTFILSLENGYHKYGSLTDKQLSALENLHRKFCKDKY